MNPARWQQIKSAFDEVLELEPAQRLAYIEDIGATDPDLRERVASLLVEHEKDGDAFLRNPAVDLEIYHELIEINADSWLGKRIGPYRLVQALGSGGMGEVYLAAREDAQFDQRVAIKLIRSGQESAAVVSRFKAERQILAGLDHPNIAKLLDGGRTLHGQPYFVMEYVPGPSITRYCEQKELGIRDRLELVIQACDGVQHAHQNAVIHRDLKPSNILVVEVDGKPVCRIIDFGLAKTAAPTTGDHTLLTKFGIFMGTPGYMSPEQADLGVQNVDTRTDVYSLGAVLYTLLTGLHPFESVDSQGPSFEEWLRRLREDSPARPSARRGTKAFPAGIAASRATAQASLPADLDWVTMKALERDRERRYGTPVELAADLRRFLQHEPILARPPGTAYQARMFLRRHRVEAGAVIAVVLALIAGLSVALWQAQTARVAAREARAQELDARTQAVKVRHMSALSAEQAGDAAGQLGFASAAVARLAYAVRLDPQNPTLRSHLLQLLDEQDVWWLPRGPAMHHAKVQIVRFSADGDRIVTGSEDGSVLLWDLAAGREIGAVIHHQGAVFSLRFSPDGKRLVTSSADHTARVWDAFTGKPLGPTLTQGGEINDANFSHDGDRVVTASEDHTARVWDWRSGKTQGAPLTHDGPVYAIEYSPDDTRIVTASKDHTARIWDAGTGRPLGPPLEHEDSVHDAKFSPDGSRVLTASKDSTARVWDVRTGNPTSKPMKHTWVVRFAGFSADGTRVITSSWDRTARIWDARTGDALGEPMGLALQAVSTSFSPDGQLAFTVLQDGMVRAWNGHSGKPRGALVRLTTAEIVNAAFNAQSNLLVTVGRDGTIQTWERRASAKLRDPLRQDGTFHFMRFSPDGRRLITDSADHTATLWDLESGKAALAPLRHASDVEGAQFSVDGARIVTVAADHAVRIWDAATGESIGVPMQHAHDPAGAKFSLDGTLVLTSMDDGTVLLWDAATGEPHGPPLNVGGPGKQLAIADFSPDGQQAAAAINDTRSSSGVVRLWDVGTGNPIGQPMSHPTAVCDWHFSPDGTRIATVSAAAASLAVQGEARTIRLWDTRTGAPLNAPVTYGGEMVPPLQFTPDGKYMLIGTMDATLLVWDAFTGERVDWTISHEAGLTEARVSTDGARLVTASMDQTARVWDAHTGAPIGAPLQHDGVVWSARFSGDDQRIATASGDRTAQVWDADTHLPVTGPMRHDWPVRFALLSRDGGHVVTISVARDRLRVWPVLRAAQDEASRLADLAEAVGGLRIDEKGALVPVPDRARALEMLRTRFVARGAAPTDLDRIFDDLVRTALDKTR